CAKLGFSTLGDRRRLCYGNCRTARKIARGGRGGCPNRKTPRVLPECGNNQAFTAWPIKTREFGAFLAFLGQYELVPPFQTLQRLEHGRSPFSRARDAVPSRRNNEPHDAG